MRVEAMIAFATLALLGCLAFLSCGCTSTNIEVGRYKMHRVSFLQSVNVKVIADPEGNISVQYGNDGGGEAAGKITEGAIKAIVR